jgi:hypothetical protein
MFGRFSPISSLSLSLSPISSSVFLSYACAWRRLSPSTDGQTGEAKDLWLFYFTDQPDLSTKLTAGLEEAERGNWKEEMTNESTTMLYRALHNLIERSLLSENFLPLGKWFARPDSSVATDGRSAHLPLSYSPHSSFSVSYIPSSSSV